MDITPDAVRKIARLARLSLDDAQAGLYQEQFSRSLELVGEISALETAETAAAPALAGVLREDLPRPFPEPQRLLDLAPQREGDYYKVPKVIA